MVYEHRILAEMILGRHLSADEVVHHIDGNGHNNHLDNLQITTRGEHTSRHSAERTRERGVSDAQAQKFCPRCQTIKPRGAFTPRINHGREAGASYCRPCTADYVRERGRARRQENRR